MAEQLLGFFSFLVHNVRFVHDHRLLLQQSNQMLRCTAREITVLPIGVGTVHYPIKSSVNLPYTQAMAQLAVDKTGVGAFLRRMPMGGLHVFHGAFGVK